MKRFFKLMLILNIVSRSSFAGQLPDFQCPFAASESAKSFVEGVQVEPNQQSPSSQIHSVGTEKPIIENR